MMIETLRLYLREFTPSDYDALYARKKWENYKL